MTLGHHYSFDVEIFRIIVAIKEATNRVGKLFG